MNKIKFVKKLILSYTIIVLSCSAGLPAEALAKAGMV